MRARSAAALLVLLLLAGCATAPPGADPRFQDPCERVNRAFFSFNEEVDEHLLEPVARGWAWITPEVLRVAFDRFFTNLEFPVRFVSSLGQAEVVRAGSELARFVLNSTVGVVGFFDPATHVGLGQHDEDFGQMFGRWGIPSGSYWVIPLLGPSSPRDALGSVFDAALNLLPSVAVPLAVINGRAIAADEVTLARGAALDYYVFVRDAHVQRRRALIADDDLPEPQLDAPGDELYEFEEGSDEGDPDPPH